MKLMKLKKLKDDTIGVRCAFGLESDCKTIVL